MTEKKAFTLAEVLITLGIIGVVAVLTLPTLIQNYQEKATVNKVKKFYSVFSQAYLRAVADNGTMDTWGLVDTSFEQDEEGNNIDFTEATKASLDKFFKIMDPYFVNGGSEKFQVDSSDNKGYRLADGTSIIGLYLRLSSCASSSSSAWCGDMYIKTDNKPSKDVNGKHRPNVFLFLLYKDRIIPVGRRNEAEFNNCLNGENYSFCTAWVIQNENMDYLHCKDLSWSGKTKCK